MASAIRNSRVGDFGMDCIPVQERRTFRVALNLNDLNLVPYWAAGGGPPCYGDRRALGFAHLRPTFVSCSTLVHGKKNHLRV